MANTQRNSDLTKFEELCTSIKEDINDILLENPYTMIISIENLNILRLSKTLTKS